MDSTPPPEGHAVMVPPLSVRALAEALGDHGDRGFVTTDGVVGVRWDDALLQFRLVGEHSEILHARVVASRRLSAARRLDAYRFCNSWNHDRMLPTAYVHEEDAAQLAIAGEVSVDLEHGASAGQLATLVRSTVSASLLFARAVAELPDDATP